MIAGRGFDGQPIREVALFCLFENTLWQKKKKKKEGNSGTDSGATCALDPLHCGSKSFYFNNLIPLRSAKQVLRTN